MKFRVRIITPRSILPEIMADTIILPTNSGQMQILFNHAAIITGLEVGVLSIKSDGKWQVFAVMGGFAHNIDNGVTVIVNEVILPSEINAAEVKEKYDALLLDYYNAETRKEKAAVDVELKRARACYQAARASTNDTI